MKVIERSESFSPTNCAAWLAAYGVERFPPLNPTSPVLIEKLLVLMKVLFELHFAITFVTSFFPVSDLRIFFLEALILK
jgi:hypothetical protein